MELTLVNRRYMARGQVRLIWKLDGVPVQSLRSGDGKVAVHGPNEHMNDRVRQFVEDKLDMYEQLEPGQTIEIQ